MATTTSGDEAAITNTEQRAEPAETSDRATDMLVDPNPIETIDRHTIPDLYKAFHISSKDAYDMLSFEACLMEASESALVLDSLESPLPLESEEVVTLARLRRRERSSCLAVFCSRRVALRDFAGGCAEDKELLVRDDEAVE
eukprot:g10802.t1